MKQEALTRMVLSGLRGDIITKFQKDDTLSRSMCSFGDIVYNPEPGGGAVDDYTLSFVRDFEERFDALVYHIVDDFTSEGRMMCMLYVSKDSSLWEAERKDILACKPMAYVFNTMYPLFSEIGVISVKRVNGFLVRAE